MGGDVGGTGFARRRFAGAAPLTRRALLGAGLVSASAPAAAARGRVTIATVSANYREGLNRLAREYERKHPGVEVVVQVLPVNGYETWLRTQIPGGGSSAPDLFNANFAWGMYEKGLMVNLGPHIERNNPYTGRPWVQTLSTQFIEKFKVGGDVTFIPLDFIEIAFYYNADLYARHGLRPPRTWDEMLRQAGVLRAAGVTPFAVPGNADSYWAGTVGWIARFFTDAYLQHLLPSVMSRPGDWEYDARRNGRFRPNPADPYHDALVTVSGERLLSAVRDRRIRFDDARMAEVYARIREFSGYWQKGFHGANAQTAYTLFLTGRAAVLLDTSGALTQLMKDMADLPPRARFRWGLFAVPPVTHSRFHVPRFRGVGGPGTVLGVVKKSPAQTALTLDFLMFLSSPHAARVLVDQAVAHRRPLVGPMLIPGADLPAHLAEHFAVFANRGFEKLSFRGLMDDQQSVWEWTCWAQRYVEGDITLKAFLARYQRLMEAAVPRVTAIQKLDMDPRTKDGPNR